MLGKSELTCRLVDHHSLPRHLSTDDQSLKHCVHDEVGAESDDSNG